MIESAVPGDEVRAVFVDEKRGVYAVTGLVRDFGQRLGVGREWLDYAEEVTVLSHREPSLSSIVDCTGCDGRWIKTDDNAAGWRLVGHCSWWKWKEVCEHTCSGTVKLKVVWEPVVQP